LIEALRQWRAPKSRDLSLARPLRDLTADLRRSRGSADGLRSAWDELAPPAIRASGHVERLSPNGVLTIRLSHAAAAYDAEQWLRGGGFDALRARSTKSVRAYRIVAG
jgi:hypothetical protein